MFYSRPFIEQRIKEEKFRAYRTGLSFSVVLFTPFRRVPDVSGNHRNPIKRTIEFLEQETRETDIKGWWDKRTIAILLLDTQPRDALLLVDKLLTKMHTNMNDCVTSIEESSIKIFTFPDTQEYPAVDNDGERDSSISDKELTHNITRAVSQMKSPCTNFSVDSFPHNSKAFIKRWFDILVSGAGLVMLSPLFLIVAILIKVDSSGPIFYRQTRVGKGGKGFTFLKFRSMQHNADEHVHRIHVKNLLKGKAGLSADGSSADRSCKLAQDGRITRIGRFLRMMSIDELPQLINVLRGEMTMVGPRPHPVYEVDEYKLWQHHRLDVKPGITGLGQAYGRFNKEYEEIYRLDIRYLKMASLIIDLRILLKTIPVVLSRRGAR